MCSRSIVSLCGRVRDCIYMNMVSFSKACFPGDHSHLWVSFSKTELPRALPKHSCKIQFFIVSNKSLLYFESKGIYLVHIRFHRWNGIQQEFRRLVTSTINTTNLVNPKGNQSWIFIGKNWCWRWSSNILATWYKKLTHWKRPWCWERLKAGKEDNRGWDGWMVSLIRWTWVSASSGS